MMSFYTPARLLGIFLLPALYAAVKIAAGILVLHFGKRYAKKVIEEENCE